MKYDKELKKKYLVKQEDVFAGWEKFYLSKDTVDKINAAASEKINRNNNSNTIARVRTKELYTK